MNIEGFNQNIFASYDIQGDIVENVVNNEQNNNQNNNQTTCNTSCKNNITESLSSELNCMKNELTPESSTLELNNSVLPSLALLIQAEIVKVLPFLELLPNRARPVAALPSNLSELLIS